MQSRTFAKPATTYDEQLAKLTRRGLLIHDSTLARRWLKTVGYYRLAAYWLIFEKPTLDGQPRNKSFTDNVTFEQIVNLYTFDRELRLLVTEAIERTEIAMRASWTYNMAVEYGSHCYMEPKLFDFNLKHYDQISRLAHETNRSNETFIKHYKKNYDTPIMPPIWMVSELMTLGGLSFWMQNTANNRVKQKVARDVGLPNLKTFIGTLQLLSYVRNICAHHGRLWNRKLVKRLPKLTSIRESLVMVADKPNVVDNNMFNTLTVLIYLLKKQSPDTSFATRISALIDSQPDYIREGMGVPLNWKELPLWRD